MKKLVCVVLSVLFIIGGFPMSVSAADIYDNTNLIHPVIHDPSIVKANDGGYYIVGSHIVMSKSDDLVNWQDLGYSIDGKTYFAHPWKEELAEALEWTSKYQYSRPDLYNEKNHQYNCWANDIIYNKSMGKYCLYGSCSVWGATSSVIWLCVSDNIEGPYSYVDSFIYTGITNYDKYVSFCKRNNQEVNDSVIEALDYKGSNITELIDAGYYNIPNRQINDVELFNSYIPHDWKSQNTLGSYFTDWGAYDCWAGKYPNAIDPTAYVDENGEYWMVYGSYSGGCFVVKLNGETGLPDYDYMSKHKSEGYDVYYGKQISKTNEGTEGTGEGPYIIYDNVSGYYYFFLTYGGLAGDGGYNIREYRSKNPDGPFVDVQGFDATDAKNTGLKLDGNYHLECQPSAYLSGGHSSCLIDDDGSMYQVYHTRYTADNGAGFKTVVHKMVRTADGWAVLLPYEYKGEKQADSYSAKDVVGTYQLVDSTNMTQRLEKYGVPISSIVLPTQYITLNADGTISNASDYSCTITNTNTGYTEVSGNWSMIDGTCYATIKLGNVIYNGAFCVQKEDTPDEKPVMTFAGAGSDNSTIFMAEHYAHNYVDYRIEPQIGVAGRYGSRCEKCLIDNPNIAPVVIPALHQPVVNTGNNIQHVQQTPPANPEPQAPVVKVKKPKKVTLSKVTAGKKRFKASWKRVSGASGYLVQYSTSKKFTKKTTKKLIVKGAKKTSATIKKLKSKKKYYVRVRAYKNAKSGKLYGSWSKVKTVKVK